MLHFIGVTVSGLMWVIPSIFLWPIEYCAYQLEWPLLILPLSAAAVATYYTWTTSYVSFIVLAVVPISVRFFHEDGNLFNILGLLALFFIAVLLRAGQVMHTDSVRALEFGIRNEVLNKDLREGIAIREQLNKQLSGMLPICASCKSIRNDRGSWEKLESYFMENSSVEFSHSICPEYAKQLYQKYIIKHINCRGSIN